MVALGTESGTVELYRHPKIIENSGSQLQILTKYLEKIVNNELTETEKKEIEACQN